MYTPCMHVQLDGLRRPLMCAVHATARVNTRAIELYVCRMACAC